MERELEILGLPPDATLEEARRAYRDLVRRWHPDRLPPEMRAEGTARLAAANRAWEALRGRGARTGSGGRPGSGTPGVASAAPGGQRLRRGMGVAWFRCRRPPAATWRDVVDATHQLGDPLGGAAPAWLEARLWDPGPARVALRLYREGGGTLVAVGVIGAGPPAVAVRDRYVTEINRLDEPVRP